MSLSTFDDPAALGSGWTSPASDGDIVQNALRKAKIIKEIAAAQEDLRALVSRVQSVEGDVDKLKAGNETLQLYIDNLTLQMAKRG